MIIRQASTQGIDSEALYSPCSSYRYGLRRRWGPGGVVLFVMLNPSTATEERNDPTIERCQRRAQRMGFDGVAIANLFAYRATDPKDLRRAAEPVGEANDTVLRDWAGAARMTVAAWGVHGALVGRAGDVARWLAGDVRHLGLTRAGHPRHPLYVSYDVAPAPWPFEQRYAGDGRG